MTNSWSFLYDEMNMDDGTLNLGTPIPGAMGDDHITFHLDMNKDSNRYKYSEDEILKELTDYISGTYNQHYSAGDDKIQTLDLIEETVVMVKHSADLTSSSMPLVMIRKALPDVTL